MIAGDKEGLENSLIQAIEQKAGHPEYRAGRKSIYDELERLLPEKEYPLVLSIIDQGYSLLEDEPITDQIAKEVRNFSKHINSLVEEKHKEFEERYPEWFNDNIKLQVQVTHPLITCLQNRWSKKERILSWCSYQSIYGLILLQKQG